MIRKLVKGAHAGCQSLAGGVQDGGSNGDNGTTCAFTSFEQCMLRYRCVFERLENCVFECGR